MAPVLGTRLEIYFSTLAPRAAGLMLFVGARNAKRARRKGTGNGCAWVRPLGEKNIWTDWRARDAARAGAPP
ncbi:MAG: hypothetical protein B6D41_09880 [Chloroflexi bacterium UTCFX4]|nr:MAG: hypothetical protein B6D41_09880 [Chloroflexi bacterium UTCFX4]